jgi:nitrogen fixation protein NifU and related proteins
MNTMDALYQENILDHYKHPHNKRRMEDAHIVEKGHNASCGDDLVLYLKWEGDTLAEISFEGFGCAISQSGASMLTDHVRGWTKEKLRAFTQKDMYDLYGVEIGPQREKCAMLALSTLNAAIDRSDIIAL